MDPGPVFGALSDPTRREMLSTLLRDGTTSVPALTAALPISRQAVAKHLATLGDAGLVERVPTDGGREVHYRLRDGALDPASAWLRDAEAAWTGRLGRLKERVETAR
jgi:DNA-binding transcriptional ArsR family regulator